MHSISSFEDINCTIESAKINTQKDTITLTYQNDYKVNLQVCTDCCDEAEFVLIDGYPLSKLKELAIEKITEVYDKYNLLDHISDDITDNPNGNDCVKKHVYKIKLLGQEEDFYLGAIDISNGYYDLTFHVNFT